MGINGFWIFLNDIVKKIDIDKIKFKPLIIDINLYIYKYVIGLRNNVNNKYPNSIHIYALYRILRMLLNYNILPICIFDGKTPKLKQDSVNRRKQLSHNANEKIVSNNLNPNLNLNQYIKNYKKSFVLTYDMIEECKIFLDHTGLPYVESIGEGDPQCAALSHYYSNSITGVLSDDSDIITYGSKILFKEIDPETNIITYISQQSIIEYLQNKTNNIRKENNLESLTFTFDAFIDFTIVLGNDYANGIRSSQKICREELFKLFVLNDLDINKLILYIYKINTNYEKILYYIPENFLEKYSEIKKLYLNVEIINPSNINIHMSNPNLTKLKDFLTTHNFLQNDILILSNILIQNYKLFSIKKI
jgi:5'-3' exonuclease